MPGRSVPAQTVVSPSPKGKRVSFGRGQKDLVRPPVAQRSGGISKHGELHESGLLTSSWGSS
eukprot:7340416-Pyramimonas_sp.AAC.1